MITCPYTPNELELVWVAIVVTQTIKLQLESYYAAYKTVDGKMLIAKRSKIISAKTMNESEMDYSIMAPEETPNKLDYINMVQEVHINKLKPTFKLDL